MFPRRFSLLLVPAPFLLAGAALLVACGGNGSTGAASSADESSGTCTATFTWWQKDAYKNAGGRNDPLWPPHTTTEMQITCGGQVVTDTSMTNHGTALGQFDDAGAPMLTEMKQVTATGSQDQMTALVGAYQSCACDPAVDGGPGTQFLSADAPNAVMLQILASATDYLSQNLQCPASPSTADIVTMLQSGDIDDAADAMSQCTWADGSSFDDGLQQAASAVLSQTGQVLDSYHVCNNDGELQAGLFAAFASDGTIASCDPASSVCTGPSFFYTP
jgi:hypothetical protein